QQSGGDDAGQDRADVDAARLGTDLIELARIGDRLIARVHVLQPARGERHARLRADLKKADRGGPRRQEHQQPPRTWRLEYEHRSGHTDRDRQKEQSTDETTLSFARTDVGAEGGSGHGVDRTRTRAPSVSVSGGCSTTV